MINLIEITTESISILMCLHRLSGQKFVWKKSMCFLILLEILGIVMQRYFEINYLLTISIGIIVFLYIRWYLTSEIFRIAKLLGRLFVLMPCMQLTVYYITKFILDSHINRNIYGIVINLLIILGILFYRYKNILIVTLSHMIFNTCFITPMKYNVILLAFILILSFIIFNKKIDTV